MNRHYLLGTSAIALCAIVLSYRDPAIAQTAPAPATVPATAPAAPAPAAAPVVAPSTASGDTVALPPVAVTAAPAAPPANGVANVSISSQVQRYALPNTRESVNAEQIQDTTNAVDPEDAVKYLPSIFVRKRDYGDNQPTLETRTWGVNSSARSLVYVDDVPISALVANNNTIGAPRWAMVNVNEITGIDMLYGPFSAEYPGNSMGGVMLITTRMPEQLEATATQTGALQTFHVYDTDHTYGTSQTSASIGDRYGKVSWYLSANHLISDSQPLIFITNGSAPAGTTGTIPALSKTGAVADVVGAGGLLHSDETTVNAKVAVDLTDWLKATYSVGVWDNAWRSSVQSYLKDANGNTTFGGVSGFGTNSYTWDETHLMNALSLKTDTKDTWDWEVVATRYDFLTDIQRSSAGVLTGDTLKPNGYVARLDGTSWSTQDAKGIWRPNGYGGAQEISFGVHRDEYDLVNPTYNTPNWVNSSDTGNGTLYTDGHGKTQTLGLWAQDAWKFAPGWTLTVGGRVENWTASDGYNLSTASNGKQTAANQPTERSTDVSPKASIAWNFLPDWTSTFSYGQAHRYPTVGELYQIVSTGSTYAIPNPNLTPETDNYYELAVERKDENTRFRVSLFQEDTTNALVQQTNLINNVNTSFWQNVGETRNRGVEFVAEAQNVFVRGLSFSNSVTYVDSRIVSDPTFVSTTGTTATGKHVPYVPDWRDTVVATYKPTDELAFTAAARYSGKMYTTLDNTDTVSHVFGAFDKFFVVDLHANYQVAKYLSASAGIDNVFNEKYFEYHPFPGRTYVMSAKLQF